MSNEISHLTESGNYTSSDQKYQDGIINPDIYGKEDIKILWILRETNGNFNIINWWGNKEYLEKGINPFDRNKVIKGTKRPTWEKVAKVCYKILNGIDCKDDFELAECLQRVAEF